jgi:hypothetical protein
MKVTGLGAQDFADSAEVAGQLKAATGETFPVLPLLSISQCLAEIAEIACARDELVQNL